MGNIASGGVPMALDGKMSGSGSGGCWESSIADKMSDESKGEKAEAKV